jgi:cell division septum initiation protein DivIVA
MIEELETENRMLRARNERLERELEEAKQELPTPLEVKDVLRATGLLTNSQSWDVAEEVMKLLAAHGITKKEL